MKRDADRPTKKPARVAEPVQVYLDPAENERLKRLAARLDTTKSDVLRRGLAALESLSRRKEPPSPDLMSLPTFGADGLRPEVELESAADLLDLMDDDDAAR